MKQMLFNNLEYPTACPFCENKTENPYVSKSTRQNYFLQHFPYKISHEFGRIQGNDVLMRWKIAVQFSCRKCERRFTEVYEA